MARLLRLTVVLLVVVGSTTACEDRRADKAYLRGDYGATAQDLEFLAKSGEPRAQYDLGYMYDKGQGVPQSDAKAREWYERAGEQGEPRAQYNLGLMHLNGQGVKPDLVQAYYWISLSAAQGDTQALDARDYVSEKMSEDQIVEAKQLVRKHDAKVAEMNACLTCRILTGKPAP
jgi:TPR repeat protein